jgi:hypothetical protein
MQNIFKTIWNESKIVEHYFNCGRCNNLALRLSYDNPLKLIGKGMLGQSSYFISSPSRTLEFN